MVASHQRKVGSETKTVGGAFINNYLQWQQVSKRSGYKMSILEKKNLAEVKLGKRTTTSKKKGAISE